MRSAGSRHNLNSMKNLIVLTVLVLTMLSGPVSAARAAVLPDFETAELESNSVTAMRTLITRCLPSVLSGKGVATVGLSPASEATTRRMLGSRQGSVWLDFDARVVMVDFQDAAVCRVVALSIDPAVLADLVMRVFSESETPFTRDRFRLDEGGGFAAVYSLNGKSHGVVIRISTAWAKDGGRFATLTVERSVQDAVEGHAK